ncbi:MAG: hypothetical protein CMI54_04655 [Parcubacteria group bacterium]|nr:hypothetical protein [Parcubacteria group bacterium]|tara:strand:+ start:5640 stop:5912 length:273 start_codon:yes stop_codon:yes gene_type:complete
MKDLFGEIPVQTIEESKAKTTVPRGYASPPGSGPSGKTCRQCEHYIIRYTAAGYTKPKCGLNRAKWTNGRASDIKVSSPACSKFETEIKN